MKKKLRMISWIPAFVFMIIIYCFSAKNGVESTKASHIFSEPILSSVQKVFSLELSEGHKEQLLDQIDFVIRKGAHMTEYLILALLIAFCLWTWNVSNRRLYILAIILTASYAATDEFHQLFVPGRSGQVKDVMIDTTGALLGMLVLRFLKRNKEKLEIV